MKHRLAMSGTFRFDAPGTLEHPGPIGRLVRLSLGLLMAWMAWRVAFHSDPAVTTIPWPTIVNGGLLGAMFLYFATENPWGKYFNPRN